MRTGHSHDIFVLNEFSPAAQATYAVPSLCDPDQGWTCQFYWKCLFNLLLCGPVEWSCHTENKVKSTLRS